jgi:hybrid cluster-associated redox disulfide protein
VPFYYKSAQPVPGKGEAITIYECDEKFNILRYLTHIPATSELDCIADPLVKKMTNMAYMEPSSQEEFEALWMEPEPEEKASQAARAEGHEGPYFHADMPVAEAVRMHPRVAEVLAAFRLGGCGSCGIGQVETLGQVCMAYGVDVEYLLEVLEDLMKPAEEPAG